MDKPIFGGPGSSDPQVRVKIAGFDQQKTPYIRKTLAPVWNHKMVFQALTDSSLSATVVVEDHNDINLASHIGRVAIPLYEFDNKKPVRKWYKLLNKQIESDGVERGEVELLIQWKWTTASEEVLQKKKAKEEASITGKLARGLSTAAKTIGVKDNSDSEISDDADEDEKEEEIERGGKKDEKETEEEKKKEEEKKTELQSIEIKSGDYQVIVHIIEARELKAENLDGTSDPVCYIECFGQKRNTQVIKGVTSCVFDETFIFNLRDLDKETFEEGVIRVSCKDSGLIKNTMIGAYAVDATLIYCMNKDHEFYRQWVPLMDDSDPEDVGVQGYLKLSISIVGPGEKAKIHDEEAERAAEIAKEAAAGSDVSSLVLHAPTIQKEWKYVVCRVYKCEGLPVMDGKLGIGMLAAKQAGTDAFCQMTIAGGKPLKTKVNTVVGNNRKMINPIFNVELWYPISLPTTTQIVKFSVWDEDNTENELIGNIIEKYNIIKKAERQNLGIRWYNIYGAPEFKQESAVGNIKKVGVAIAKTAKQTLGADINWSSYYNNTPDKASCFKGRALLEFCIMDKRPEKKHKKKKEKLEIKPFRLKMKHGYQSSREPPARDYVLQALVIAGSDLPHFGLGPLINQQLRIQVCIGINELCTKPAKFEHGTCRWSEQLKSERIVLPADIEQIPDIFIYLLREDNKPVCFYRMKPWVLDESKKKQFLGFEREAEWVLMQEDKSIDALDKEVFPGTVLIKLGFGYADEAELKQESWKRALEKSRELTPYQMRIHVFQCRNIPAADSNGLSDPFLKIRFAGRESIKTKVKKKTLFPTYYETHVLDDVQLPHADKFTYAPPLSIKLYDEDAFGTQSEYLGRTLYYLKDAVVTENPNLKITELPDPQWCEFFFEVPKDSQGEALILVQLIPTLGRSVPKPEQYFEVPTRNAFIEFLVIGMRDMAPYDFLPMQAPYISMELSSFGSVYKSTTGTSKKPEPANPNYLERIVMPVTLPDNALFSTPLQIKAHDTRLGGYLKPIVGVCQIDLTHKLPWCESLYVPPAKDLFFQDVTDMSKKAENADGGILPGANSDQIALKAIELTQKRKGELETDDLIGSQEPVSVEGYIKERVALEDSGAGVFGALNHINVDGSSKKKKRPEDAFSDPDWEGDPDSGDQPPAWAIGRKKLAAELEAEFKTTPFETYSLTRGKVNGFLGSKIKVVGRLKGLVRVVEQKELIEQDPLLPKDLMNQLLKPKSYAVRLYVLKGVNLEAVDRDIFGNAENSDPYLKITLGKQVFDDRKNAVNDVTNVDFYKLITFDTELPGISQLNVNVMDKNVIGGDVLIGKTCIDLEDRWFDARWQEWGKENLMLPGSDPNDKTKVRWKTKPIELRSIYAPGFSLGRGVVECWLDLMTSEESSAFPPDDVSLPPTQIFEVRVVIWKSKNVPPMDSFEGMSDLFVKAWPEGCDPQETDTHWRCKKGKASWNWRMLFDVELGHNTRAMKFPYFHLQLWDRDLLKWNDCAGEGIIDLGKFYRKAYKRNIAIKLFEKKKGLAAKRAAKKEKKKRSDLMIEDTTDDIPPEEEDDEDLGSMTFQPDEIISPLRSTETANAVGDGKYVQPSELIPYRDQVDSDDEEDSHLDTGLGAIPKVLPKKEHRMLVKKPEIKKKAKKVEPPKTETPAANSGGAFSWVYFWRKREPVPTEEKKEGEEGKDEEQGKDGDGNEKTEEEKKDDEDSELKELLTSFKNMTGLWDIDPDDSA